MKDESNNDLKKRFVYLKSEKDSFKQVSKDEIDFELIEKTKKEKESPLSITNILWLLAAVGVFYFSDILKIILYNDNINRYVNSSNNIIN
jgi:hypothetical protein